MPRSIVLVFDPIGVAPATLAKDLTAAFQAPSGFDHTVNIIHYAFAVPLLLPGVSPKVLVIAVYDENFADYVVDIVTALIPAFNAVADFIQGMKELKPLQKNLTAFTDFLLTKDLSHGGEEYIGDFFFQAYPYTVNQIRAATDAGFFSNAVLNPA